LHPDISPGAFFLPSACQKFLMAQIFSDFVKSRDSRNPHYFVIGHPISHSLSPLMHNAALQYYGMEASYHAVDVSPAELPAFISWCNKDAFLGCNITLPYKQQLFDVVDTRGEKAEEIGAINTISKKNGELTGNNTDVHGFLEPLTPVSEFIEDTDAIVFGTGGASAAVVQGLRSLGIHKIYLVSRKPSIKQTGNHDIEYIGYSQWASLVDNVSIVVNTTPLGMHPHTDQSPVRDSEAHLLKGKICYDLVYNPLETVFLKQAKPFAEKIITGIDMLIHQGSRSFEIWTGKTFPIERIKTELISYFRSV